MPTKLNAIKALSDATVQRITSSRKDWMDYLDTTAWLYKYPFNDQLMIYAQRPDARACAPIELWNRVFKRWVKRGSKGIALMTVRQMAAAEGVNEQMKAANPLLWTRRMNSLRTMAEETVLQEILYTLSPKQNN